MKIRAGFVSNSSSSSFIVVGLKTDYDYSDYEYNLSSGVCEFGWGPERLFDITSRINWVMVLAKTEEDFNLIERVLKSVLKKKQYKKDFNFFKDRLLNHDGKLNDYTYAYIDHQSKCDTENLFKDENKMKAFIFNEDSFIQLDNDNY